MFALTSTTEYPAMAAGSKQCTQSAQGMPVHSARQSSQAMCDTWTAASILPLQTGVLASVSLFALLPIPGFFLIVGILVLVGLLSLSCLTGLVVSLVGLIKGLSPGTETGD